MLICTLERRREQHLTSLYAPSILLTLTLAYLFGLMGLLDDVDLILCGHAGQNDKSRDGRSASEPKRSLTRQRAADEGEPSSSTGDSFTSNAATQPTPFLDMTLAELQAEVSKYGFRPSKRRSLLLKQLQGVQHALEQAAGQEQTLSEDLSSILSSSPPSSSLVRPHARQETVDLISDDDEDESGEMGDLTMAMLNEERAGRITGSTGSSVDDRHSASAPNEASEDDAEDLDGLSDGDENGERAALAPLRGTANEPALGTVPAAVAQQLHDAVLADEDLYRRILLFEPIAFDEFSSLAKRENVQGLRNKETLRNWLDVQCICFYSAELTGQRTRY